MAAKKIQGAGPLSNEEKAQLLEDDPRISRSRQCELLDMKRTTSYYKHRKKPVEKTLAQALHELYILDPCLGYRKLPLMLKRHYGIEASEDKVRRARKRLGLETQYQHPDTSAPGKGKRKLKKPYLLKDMVIDKRDLVWTSDITYLPMGKGHIYLCAVMDWASREVLGWNISNSMDADFCVKALEMALATGRKPLVINTDQGVQYTSEKWVECVTGNGILISMDGKGRWADNVRMERFWRTYKYDLFFIWGAETTGEVKRCFVRWVFYYNNIRPHQSLAYETPAAWGEGHRADISAPLPAPLPPPRPTGSGTCGAPVGAPKCRFSSKKGLTDTKQSTTMTTSSMEGAKPI